MSGLHQLSGGTLADAGYHAIALASSLSITRDVPFYVAVRLTTPGYSYPVPIEYPIPGWAAAVASLGQSYISSTGSSWVDVAASYTNTNVCLKAFTGAGASTTPPPTVKIEFTGTKNVKATSTAVNLDAVDVMGVLTQAP